MVTRVDIRGAGAAALVTAAFLGASQILFQGGPPSNPQGLLRWFASESGSVRAAAVLWLLAMLGLGVFAVAFREAMWATVLDHPTVTLLFLQGAAVFATVAVVATATTWALAVQVPAGTIDAQQAATLWEVGTALLLFATWGLAAPLVVVSIALWRHSMLGQVAAVTGVLMAVALLLPFHRPAVLVALSGWLALVGATLLIPTQRESEVRIGAPSDVIS